MPDAQPTTDEEQLAAILAKWCRSDFEAEMITELKRWRRDSLAKLLEERKNVIRVYVWGDGNVRDINANRIIDEITAALTKGGK